MVALVDYLNVVNMALPLPSRGHVDYGKIYPSGATVKGKHGNAQAEYAYSDCYQANEAKFSHHRHPVFGQYMQGYLRSIVLVD